MAKKINWSPPSWNMPNINFSPFNSDSKAFMKETMVPAFLQKRYDNTGMEAMNWYYYMKKHHPADLIGIENLIPATFLSANTAPQELKPYVPEAPVNMVPDGYEGQTYHSFEDWGNGEDFFVGSNNRFPGK